MNIFKKLAAWIPALLVGMMILSFSAQTGDESQGLSNKVACIIIDMADAAHIIDVTDDNRTEYISAMQLPVRKGAHMTEYALFGLSVMLGLYVWGWRGWQWYAAAIIVSMVFAATDEFHQLFVPQRSGKLTDVLIDTAGAAIAVMITRIINGGRKNEEG